MSEDQSDWTNADNPDGYKGIRIPDWVGRKASVQCLLLFAILEELKAQRKAIEKLVERSSIV